MDNCISTHIIAMLVLSKNNIENICVFKVEVISILFKAIAVFNRLGSFWILKIETINHLNPI